MIKADFSYIPITFDGWNGWNGWKMETEMIISVTGEN